MMFGLPAPLPNAERMKRIVRLLMEMPGDNIASWIKVLALDKSGMADLRNAASNERKGIRLSPPMPWSQDEAKRINVISDILPVQEALAQSTPAQQNISYRIFLLIHLLQFLPQDHQALRWLEVLELQGHIQQVFLTEVENQCRFIVDQRDSLPKGELQWAEAILARLKIILKWYGMAPNPADIKNKKEQKQKSPPLPAQQPARKDKVTPRMVQRRRERRALIARLVRERLARERAPPIAPTTAENDLEKLRPRPSDESTSALNWANIFGAAAAAMLALFIPDLFGLGETEFSRRMTVIFRIFILGIIVHEAGHWIDVIKRFGFKEGLKNYPRFFREQFPPHKTRGKTPVWRIRLRKMIERTGIAGRVLTTVQHFLSVSIKNTFRFLFFAGIHVPKSTGSSGIIASLIAIPVLLLIVPSSYWAVGLVISGIFAFSFGDWLVIVVEHVLRNVAQRDVTIEGLQNLPRGQSILLAGNHPSAGLDGALITAKIFLDAYQKPAFLTNMRRTDFVIRKMVEAGWGFPINGKEDIERVAAALRANPGAIIGFLPAEAGRTRETERARLIDWSTGVAVAAIKAGVPVLPFAVYGRIPAVMSWKVIVRLILSRMSFGLIASPFDVTIVFGQPLSPPVFAEVSDGEGVIKEEAKLRFIDEIKQRVEWMLLDKQINGHHFSPRTTPLPWVINLFAELPQLDEVMIWHGIAAMPNGFELIKQIDPKTVSGRGDTRKDTNGLWAAIWNYSPRV